MTHDADPDVADYVSHEQFRAGLPRGRFRVIVNPKLARGYLRQRLWLLPIVISIIGAGLAFAFAGQTVASALLVFAGVALNRGGGLECRENLDLPGRPRFAGL